MVRRIRRIESARYLQARQAWVSSYVRHGLPGDAAIADFSTFKHVLEQCPPRDIGNGLVDIERTAIAMAEAFGLDPDEVLREVEKVKAEAETNKGYR